MRPAFSRLGTALTSLLLGGLAQAQPPVAAPAPSATTPTPTYTMPYAGPQAGGAYAAPYAAPMPYPRYPPPRVAPDMCGPGWWGVNRCGAPFGPNHCVYPPFPPYNGERPCLGGAPAFLPHPYARGPRDYFMLD